MLLALILTVAARSMASAAGSVGPARGFLVIHGGGESPEPLDEFVRLAGGAKARLVVIPTAAGLPDYGERFQTNYFRPFREKGVVDVHLLHATDRATADSDAFITPLTTATGVWFAGGRQWRLADAYLDSKTERALWAVLERGGVIGGGSAGATIQGSYLVRGDRRGALIPIGDHQRGFGFLKSTAIDQHFLERNRQFDLLEVIRAHPDLLGIGIDTEAGIVVEGDEFRVIGSGYVAIYDPRIIIANGHFYFLKRGQRFDLRTRTPMSAEGEPLWIPHVLPRAVLTRRQLRELAGTYVTEDGPIHLMAAGKRISATLCPGDERELIPISADVLYDNIDGSKVTIMRNARGTAVGLTWDVARIGGQRGCREGRVEAFKKQP
jgi:cyanophycinase